MIRSNVCDYNDAYTHVKANITVPNTATVAAPVHNANIKVIFKNFAPFTSWINEINNTQVNDAQDIDIVIPMHNLIEYSNAYSTTSGSLWQYKRDEPALDNNNNIIDFPANNNNSISFKVKQQLTGEIGNGGTKDVEIMVPLKYLSNFWRKLEMPLINYEITLQLKWSRKCILVARTPANQLPEFKITDSKLCVPVVTLSTQDNVKLLKELESRFNLNQAQTRYLDFLIDLSFQGVNRLFILSFKDEDGRESYTQYYLSNVEIKYYNVLIDGRKFLDQIIKNY